MTDATELDEAAIRARLETATPGPWDLHMVQPDMGGRHQYGLRGSGKGPQFAIIGGTFRAEARNAEFIAHARTDVERLLAALDEARAEVDTHREVAESMTGLWEQAKDRADRLEAMADRLADRRANHEPWHCCCAEGSHSGQAHTLNRMKARAEAAESALAAVRAPAEDLLDSIRCGLHCDPDGKRSPYCWACEDSGEDHDCPPREVCEHTVPYRKALALHAALATPTTPEETQR